MNAALWIAVAASATLLTACGSWVEVKPQARDIVALAPAQASQCRQLGKVSASVLNEAGFFDRSRQSIEADLTKLARNRAVELGGDAVAPLGPEDRGKQTFGVYRCFHATAGNGAATAAKDRQATSGFKTIPYNPSGHAPGQASQNCSGTGCGHPEDDPRARFPASRR